MSAQQEVAESRVVVSFTLCVILHPVPSCYKANLLNADENFPRTVCLFCLVSPFRALFS